MRRMGARMVNAQHLDYTRRHRQALKRARRERVDALAPTDSRRRRDWWLAQCWTLKVCAVCGRPDIELHHARYRYVARKEPFYLVPLCPHHHADLSLRIWPWLRRWLTPTEATLFYIVHGERLHRLLSPQAPPQPTLF